MTIHDIYEAHEQKKVERMMLVAPDRPISVLYEALKTCHGSFDDAIDIVLSQEVGECPTMINSDIEDFDPELEHIKAQTGPAGQQMEVTTRTLASSYSTMPESSMTIPSAAVERSSSLVSTDRTPTVRTNFKSSTDHFAASAARPSKKQVGDIIKNGLKSVPGVPAQKDTIRDKFEKFQALLQSSRSLPNPTSSTKKRRGRRGGFERIRGLGPGTGVTALNSEAKIPDHVSTASESTTPGSPSDMIRPSIEYHGERFGGLQLSSSSPQTPPQIPPGLDIDAFNAASHAQQKQMIGEILYLKVSGQQLEFGGKITGMLLEMDNADIFHLIADEAALRNKIEEALRLNDEWIKANHGEDV